MAGACLPGLRPQAPGGRTCRRLCGKLSCMRVRAIIGVWLLFAACAKQTVSTEERLCDRGLCPQGYACGTRGTCVSVGGASCSTSDDCTATSCPPGAVPTCTLGNCYCGTPQQQGAPCQVDLECLSFACECVDDQCALAMECATQSCGACMYATSDGTCDPGNHLAAGVTQPNRCAAPRACFGDGCKLSLGADCSSGTHGDCESGFCECTSPDCSSRACAGAACICQYGPLGTCGNPLNDYVQDVGDCDAGTNNSQCIGGLCTPMCTAGAQQSQPCGTCGMGTQIRQCNGNHNWGPWAACTGGGACSPGATQSCGYCGTQTCQGDCTWGPCAGAGVCSPLQSNTQACGSCNSGTQSQTCQNDCTWSAWSACSGGGACSPGATLACGNCNTGTKTCQGNCTWGSCLGGGACSVGQTNVQACGNCNSGTQSQSCRSDCTWGAWLSCSGGGLCSPGASVSCGYCTSGTQTCQGDCSWGACSVNDCQPTASQSCGNCGTQFCGSGCQWGLCQNDRLANGTACSSWKDCCSLNCDNTSHRCAP